MDPRPFARLSVGSLALRLRSAGVGRLPSGADRHKFSCIISLYPLKQSQTVRCVPLIAPLNRSGGLASPQFPAECFFYLDETALQKLADCGGGARLNFKVMQEMDGYGGGAAAAIFGGRTSKCVGKLSVPIKLEWLTSGKQKVVKQGWAPLVESGSVSGDIWRKRCCVMLLDHADDDFGQNQKESNNEPSVAFGGRSTGVAASAPAVHLIIRADLDPRFVFEFDSAPDQSPQILHVQGHIKQPIFSCKFARSRSSHSRGALSLSGELRSVYPASGGGGGGGGLHRGGGGGAEREETEKKTKAKKKIRERKGWVLLIHDLSGKAVAAASMVTPFVPAPAAAGHVSRASPGAWLILRAATEAPDTWQPWARLEAWHERRHHIACRLLLPLPPPPPNAFPPNSFPPSPSPATDDSLQLVSQCSLSLLRGGDFAIDASRLRIQRHSASSSPFRSPCHSGNLGAHLGGGAANLGGGIPAYAAAAAASAGFVMSTTLRRRGGKTCGVPRVQIALRHISSLDDAAVFVALAAAVQLSVEACSSLCPSPSSFFLPCLP